MEQWDALKATLEQCGAKVDVMEADVIQSQADGTKYRFQGANNLPDMVFAANAAVIRGNKAYLANFAHPERKGER